MHVQGISRDTWPLNPKLHLALGIRGLWPRMEHGNYDLGLVDVKVFSLGYRI